MSQHSDDFQSYVDSPQKQQQLYQRTLWIVVMSQIFGGAGLAAGITVGALIAKDMLGTDGFAGLPIAILTLGSAGAALTVGRLSQRFGRRIGLASGFFAGGLGAIGVIFAVLNNNVFLFFAALLIYGAGTSTNLQARYAGTDLANVKQRGKAISIAMVSTTLGAVAGPNLVGVMGDFALSIGVPTLAGPFILGAFAFIGAGFVLLLLLRPDPLIVAKFIAEAQQENRETSTEVYEGTPSSKKSGVTLGATVMVITQVVMVAIMTMTPVHMRDQGHSLNAVGMVISIHVAAMYLQSVGCRGAGGRFGRLAMTIAAGVTLMSAGIVAAFASGGSLFVMITSLALLGLGWNFGLISGTALIVDSTNLSNRAKTQGKLDVLVALAGASGAGLSGMVVAQTSYATLSLAGGFLSILLIPVVIQSIKHSK